jgi:hypothetical protein
MLTNEIGDVGTERDDPQMIVPSEIQDKSAKFCGQAMPFQWFWYFGVIENDQAGKAAIGKQHTQAIDVYFESLCLLVVSHRYVVEVRVHGSPGSFAGFFRFIHEGLRMTGESLSGNSAKLRSS